MTPRTIFTATIASPAARRRRNSDNSLFGVVKLRERDRMSDRLWTGFVNDVDLIERLEGLRVGEVVAVVGPFGAKPLANSEQVAWSVTIEDLLDLKRPKKTKTAKAREERVRSSEADDAPKTPDETEAFHDDPLPF